MPPGKPPFIKSPSPLRPHPWRDGEDSIPDGIKPKPKPPPQDGDPVPDELDDAGISLDYDPVEVCATTFAEILGEELHEDDPVEIDVDEDFPSVTIGAFTFTISTTIRGGAERLARALHALGEALRHNAAEADPCPTCIAEPCACIAGEE